MAQAESRMTVAKSLAIWKRNSEVMSIEGQLENNYRNTSLRNLVFILTNQIQNQNMLSFNSIVEHSYS